MTDYKTGPRAGQQLAQVAKATSERAVLERLASLLAERAGRDARDQQVETCTDDGCGATTEHVDRAYEIAAHAEYAYCLDMGLDFTRARAQERGIA